MNPESDIYIQLLRKFEVEAKDKFNVPSRAEEDSAKQLSLLTKAFIPTLSVLRMFGNNPLCFGHVEHGNTGIVYRRFHYKMFSFLTLLSFIGQLFYVSGFALLAYRLFSGDYQPSSIPGTGRKAKHNPSNADNLMKAFFTTFFLAAQGGAECSFISSRAFANYLNAWKDFVFSFTQVFHGKYMDVTYVIKVSKLLLSYTSFLCVFYMVWSTAVYKTCIFDINNNCTRMEREQSFMFVGFGCSSIMNTTFEQLKLALMLQATMHSFSEINDKLIKSKAHFANGNYKLRALFKLVYGLRAQTRSLMEIFGSSQLLIIFFLFNLTIICWMMIIQFSAGDISFTLVMVVGSIGFVQFSRLLMMAFLCEKVVEKERLVLSEISNIKPRNAKAQIEIQIFVSVLTKKPIAFTLNNVIIVKRSLFLALFSNSTTYLIAIMQLVAVSNSDLMSTNVSSASGNVTAY